MANIDIEKLLSEAIHQDLGSRFGAWNAKSEIRHAAPPALIFTTAKQKIRGLHVSERNGDYILTAPRGLLRQASSLFRFIAADNGMVPLNFDDGLIGYEPDDQLIHRSSVPLWVLRASKDGSVMISRVWENL